MTKKNLNLKSHPEFSSGSKDCRYPPAYAGGTTFISKLRLSVRWLRKPCGSDEGAIPQPAHAGCPFAPHHGFRNKFGMTKSGERGRSMVEMLGVLAIVGVLSIAGVSGYTTAMKKHRANELLNEASKRAVVLAMKIAAGQDIEHGLDEFDSNTVNGATFSNPSAPAGNTFSMSLTGVDADVCEQMEVMMGTDGMMNIGKECTNNTCSLTLTFNKDLSKGVTSGASEPTLVESCTTGTAISNIGDTTNERTEAGDCRCPTATPQWDGSKCKEADTGGTCDDHESQVCPAGYYCKFSPSGCYDNNRGNNGVCTKITGARKIDGHWVGPNLDWWSANSWCIGKGSEGLIKKNTLQSEYCIGGSCDFPTMRNKGLTERYWSEDWGNHCESWHIYVDYEDFSYRERDLLSYALCEPISN